MPDYLLYTPDIEKIAPDEHIVFDELSRTMQHITRTMASRTRHAYRPVHAKSHGLVLGTLEVLPGLPEPLAQGLFAQAGTYPVLFRFSTNPGDIQSDKITTPKGLAIKVLNVPGEQLPTNPGHTQDFVCINGNKFASPDAAGFLKGIKQFDETLTVPGIAKEAISAVARTTNTVLNAVGIHSATLDGIGAPAVNPLGESFTTMVPSRFGKYVAKFGFQPVSENLTALSGKTIEIGDDFNALQELIQKFFKDQTGVWEVKVQLALAEDPSLAEDKKDFPIEKADTEWPEAKSPWQVVGRIVMPPQNTYSDEREIYVDEKVSFNPWHSLAAFQPLGQIQRARRKAYEEAAKYRAKRNDRVIAEPENASDIPA